jgi:hypothetical protein
VRSKEEIRAFWSKVSKPYIGCWEWQGYRHKSGYGQFSYHGKMEYTHRVAYELSTGIEPLSLYVCHDCDNPACCRPEHLFLGTAKDNAIDSKLKGRKKCSPERARNISLAKKGHTFVSKETRRRISVANKGRVVPEEVRCRTSATMKGVPKSEMHKQHLKDAIARRKAKQAAEEQES